MRIVGDQVSALDRLLLPRRPLTVAIVGLLLSLFAAPVSARADDSGSLTGTITVPNGLDPSQQGFYLDALTWDNVYEGTVTPDSSGKYTFSLESGWYRVYLNQEFVDSDVQAKPGFYPNQTTYGSARLIHVEAGSVTSGIDFSARQAGSISGVVQPAKGAGDGGRAVAVDIRTGNEVETAGIDSTTGAFTIPGLDEGNYRVKVYGVPGLVGGYAPDGRASADGATVLSLTAGATAVVNVSSLPVSASISGTLTASRRLDYVALLDHEGHTVAAADIGAAGHYSFRTDVRAGTYSLVAWDWQGQSGAVYYSSKPSLGRATPISVAAGQSLVGVDGDVPAGGTFEGTATGWTSADGDLSITAVDTTGSTIGLPPDFGGHSYLGQDWSSPQQLMAGPIKVAFGRASGDTPYVGQYYVDATHTTTDRSAATTLNVASGALTSVPISRSALRTGAQVTGTLKRADGTALAGVEVLAFQDLSTIRLEDQGSGLPVRTTRTALDGSYTIRGLLPGSYMVAADMGSYYEPDLVYYGTGTQPSAPNVTVSGTSTTSGITITADGPVDVARSSSFYGDIMWLIAQGISKPGSDGRFGPSDPVSRSAMAAFLYRAAGSPAYTPPATSPFADVTPSDPFYKEMCWLSSQGITKPGADKKFGPAGTVSREAMAAFLYRFAGSPSYTPPATSPFADVATSSTFYKEMTWLSSQGITKPGADKKFGPSGPVSREAMAAFLHRASTAGLLTGG